MITAYLFKEKEPKKFLLVWKALRFSLWAFHIFLWFLAFLLIAGKIRIDYGTW